MRTSNETPFLISDELRLQLLSWRHSGFSVHVDEPIPPNRAIEDMASHVVRGPASLKRLVYIDGHNAVVYLAFGPNPSLGANFVALAPLELARIADHIPDPGKARHARAPPSSPRPPPVASHA